MIIDFCDETFTGSHVIILLEFMNLCQVINQYE